MKKWMQQIKIPKGRGKMAAGIFDVIEHTDQECSKSRTDGKHLAPYSHGFVCLYQSGKYIGWCGTNFATDRLIFDLRTERGRFAFFTQRQKVQSKHIDERLSLAARQEEERKNLRQEQAKELKKLNARAKSLAL